MQEPTKTHPLKAILLRSTIAAILTIGAGWGLLALLGVTWVSAVLFALACGLITLGVSHLPGKPR